LKIQMRIHILLNYLSEFKLTKDCSEYALVNNLTIKFTSLNFYTL
jgi:hypothetical protein